MHEKIFFQEEKNVYKNKKLNYHACAFVKEAYELYYMRIVYY